MKLGIFIALKFPTQKCPSGVSALKSMKCFQKENMKDGSTHLKEYSQCKVEVRIMSFQQEALFLNIFFFSVKRSEKFIWSAK